MMHTVTYIVWNLIKFSITYKKRCLKNNWILLPKDGALWLWRNFCGPIHYHTSYSTSKFSNGLFFQKYLKNYLLNTILWNYIKNCREKKPEQFDHALEKTEKCMFWLVNEKNKQRRIITWLVSNQILLFSFSVIRLSAVLMCLALDWLLAKCSVILFAFGIKSEKWPEY